MTYLGYTILQEGVFLAHDGTTGFCFGSMVTLTTNLMYVVLAFLDRMANNEFRQSGKSIIHSELSNVTFNENVDNAIGGNFNFFRHRVPLTNYIILATMLGIAMY